MSSSRTGASFPEVESATALTDEEQLREVPDVEKLGEILQRAGGSLWSEIEDQAVPDELAMSLRYYNKAPRVLLKVRRQIAKRIVQLSRQLPLDTTSQPNFTNSV